jgi:hypothetical protein
MPVTDKYDFRPALLYQLTTESMIPWDWLAKTGTTELLMTERERVEMLVGAVNGDWFAVRDWDRFCGAPLKGGWLSIEGAGWADQRVPLLNEAQVSIRAALEGAMSEPETAIAEILANVNLMTSKRVIIVPEFPENGEPSDRFIAHDIGTAALLTLRITLQESYRRLLRRCALASCGRIGLGTPSRSRGQPPNFYCSDEHRAQHQRQLNSDRQAAYRQGKSVEVFRTAKVRKARAATRTKHK